MVVAEIIGSSRKIIGGLEANEKVDGFLGAGNRQH